MSASHVIGEDGRDAREGYALLAREFPPDEIDGPARHHSLLKEARLGPGRVSTLERAGEEKRIWHQWIQIVVRDRAGRLVAVRDGSVIADARTTLFYAAHIVTAPRYRSLGIGRWLCALSLHVANECLSGAERALGCVYEQAGRGRVALGFELCEVEFPDPAPENEGSRRRLVFHGRLGRSVLWPFRYSQPDTAYGSKLFRASDWNAVPMFICYRRFLPGPPEPLSALGAVNLLFDVHRTVFGEGVDWDRRHFESGLHTDGVLGSVRLPTREREIEAFVASTGSREALLQRYYPGFRYTRQHAAGGDRAS